MATSGSEGPRLVEERDFDVIITDLKMNDVDGLEILDRAKGAAADTEVILFTGFGSVPSAVEAMQRGLQLPPQAVGHPAASGGRGKGGGKRPAAAYQRRAQAAAGRDASASRA